MSLVTSVSLGFSLSMDAFAASVAQGAQARRERWRRALRMAAYCGVLEGTTPLIGWALGLWLGAVIAQVDHWIAFVLLLAIGAKMIRDGRRPGPAVIRQSQSRGRTMLIALSTSVDAAAVGLTLVVLGVPIYQAAIVIGLVTFGMTMVGFMLGGLAAPSLSRHAETLGGLLLIGIGCHTLLEHTVFA